MQYLCTTTTDTPGQEPARYSDATATELLRRAVGHGLPLAADTSTGTITITSHDRMITLRPAEPLPTPTPAQRREVLALAASHGPIVWEYGRSNVVRLRDGERWLTHQTTMSLLNGGYLPEADGRHHGPTHLTLLAYLVMGKRTADDTALAAALRNVYSQPAPARA